MRNCSIDKKVCNYCTASLMFFNTAIIAYIIRSSWIAVTFIKRHFPTITHTHALHFFFFKTLIIVAVRVRRITERSKYLNILHTRDKSYYQCFFTAVAVLFLECDSNIHISSFNK